MIYWLLRSEELCNGAYECPSSDQILCADCGNVSTIEDTNILGCPICGSVKTSALRCKECPLNPVYKARGTTEAGRLLERALELDHQVTTYNVDWNDVSAEADTCLKILRDERNKHQVEMMERNRNQI